MAKINLDVSRRTLLGRRVKALRRQGLVPANIVAKGEPSLAISVGHLQLERALKQAGYTQPINLVIDQDQTRVVLLTEVELFTTKNVYQHVVFQEIKAGQKVNVSVPLVLTGDSPGVLTGLLLIQMLDRLDVSADPLTIPEQFEVDISQLIDDGQTVRVAALKLPAGVETTVNLQVPIVRLEKSRSQVSQAGATDVDGDDQVTNQDQPAEGESAPADKTDDPTKQD